MTTRKAKKAKGRKAKKASPRKTGFVVARAPRVRPLDGGRFEAGN